MLIVYCLDSSASRLIRMTDQDNGVEEGVVVSTILPHKRENRYGTSQATKGLVSVDVPPHALKYQPGVLQDIVVMQISARNSSKVIQHVKFDSHTLTICFFIYTACCFVIQGL